MRGLPGQTCRRHYPGGIAGPCRSTPCSRPGQACIQRQRPSPNDGRVGFRITTFRGLLGVHCTLRPVCSPSRLSRPSTPKAPTASLPPPPLRLLPAGATSCRTGLTPAENPRLSRRTVRKVGSVPTRRGPSCPRRCRIAGRLQPASQCHPFQRVERSLRNPPFTLAGVSRTSQAPTKPG